MSATATYYNFRVGEFTARSLGMLASLFGAGKINVELSRVVGLPGAVQLESRTLLMNPAAGVYDLLVMALLQRNRADIRRNPEKEALPRSHVARLVREARRILGEEFPGAEQFGGLLHPATPARDRALPEVTWRDITVEPLKLGPGLTSLTTLVGNIPFRGNESDAAELVDGLASGRIPTERWSVLRELPIATVPLRFMAGGVDVARRRRREEILADPAAREAIRRYGDCYRKHAQTTLDSQTPRHRRWGTRLNFNRLVEAVVATRIGYEPRVFVSPRRELQQSFLPEDHLVVAAIDLESLRHRSGHTRRVNCMLALALVQEFVELEVDLAVLVFADALVPLPDGRVVYLHQPAILKRPSEPADGAFWGKLETALFNTADAAAGNGSDADSDSDSPGEPEPFVPSFQPLQVRTLVAEMASLGRGRNYRNFSIQYISTRMISAPGIAPGQPLHTRIAQNIDEQTGRLRTELGGFWNNLAALPKSVVAAGARDGFCSKALDNFE